MWKVSFKDPSSKKVKRFNDRVTVVTLNGFMRVPKEVMFSLPKELNYWLSIHSNPKVKLNFILKNSMEIIVVGRANRADGDVDNPVFGERLAECRAKIRLYHFLYTFALKYINHYEKILYGKDVKVSDAKFKGNNYMCSVYNKYATLYVRETNHLNKLLRENVLRGDKEDN